VGAGATATPVVAVKAAKATATKAQKTKEHNPRQRIVQAAVSHNSKELISLANEHVRRMTHVVVEESGEREKG
jgi:hypothetical protein